MFPTLSNLSILSGPTGGQVLDDDSKSHVRPFVEQIETLRLQMRWQLREEEGQCVLRIKPVVDKSIFDLMNNLAEDTLLNKPRLHTLQDNLERVIWHTGLFLSWSIREAAVRSLPNGTIYYMQDDEARDIYTLKADTSSCGDIARGIKQEFTDAYKLEKFIEWEQQAIASQKLLTGQNPMLLSQGGVWKVNNCVTKDIADPVGQEALIKGDGDESKYTEQKPVWEGRWDYERKMEVIPPTMLTKFLNEGGPQS